MQNEIIRDNPSLREYLLAEEAKVRCSSSEQIHADRQSFRRVGAWNAWVRHRDRDRLKSAKPFFWRQRSAHFNPNTTADYQYYYTRVSQPTTPLFRVLQIVDGLRHWNHTVQVSKPRSVSSSSNTDYVCHLIHDGIVVVVSYRGPTKTRDPKSMSPFTGSETSTPVESTLITKRICYSRS